MDRVQITDIHQEDSHYHRKSLLIGVKGVLRESHPARYMQLGDEGYVYARIQLDKFVDGSRDFTFCAVKYQALEGEVYTSCKWCGEPPQDPSGDECDGCWEMRRRIEDSPDLAKCVIKQLTEEGRIMS